MGAYYIVTDLILRARFDLAPLDAELKRAGLHGGVRSGDGIWRAGYSTSERCCRHPAETLEHYLGIVENLSAEARDLWNRCMSRRFDIGYQSFEERVASYWQIKGSILRRIADVDGDLVVTVYRPGQDSPPNS